MRKGVELSMNVIIIAAIALIILVLLILFVTGAFGGLQWGVSCGARQGQCLDSDLSCSEEYGEGWVSFGKRSDCRTDQVCCVRALGGGS